MITPADFAEMARAYTAAWNSGDPARVVAHYTPEGGILINRGAEQFGREAMLAMAQGFMSSFPDLKLTCDLARLAGDHALYAWTLEGHHAETGNPVKVGGFEEWELTADCRVARSLGWFDAADYDAQVAGQGAGATL